MIIILSEDLILDDQPYSPLGYPWLTLADGDELRLLAGVRIQFENWYDAAILTGTNCIVRIDGYLFQHAGPAIQLGDGSSLFVGEEGTLATSGQRIVDVLDDATIVNHGTLLELGVGVFLGGSPDGQQVRIENHGQLGGADWGVSSVTTDGDAPSDIRIWNTAEMQDSGFYSTVGGYFEVINDGSLPTLIYTLAAGASTLYDGRHGDAITIWGGDEWVAFSGSQDRVIGSQFADTVSSGGGDDRLFGLAGGDSLDGGAGSDLLRGGRGRDLLIGGPGADRFLFDAPLGTGNMDTIADFAAADTILLESSIFEGLDPGSLDDDALYIQGGRRGPFDAEDRIIYLTDGRLFFDPDGSGVLDALPFATLSGHPPVTAADFQVV